MKTVAALPNLPALRQHIFSILCDLDQLDAGQATLHEAPIQRSGKCCGLFFQIRGPRRMTNYAIWAGEENRILYYNSKGQRFAESQLLDSPDPSEVNSLAQSSFRSFATK
jgi:hypothetical protein